MSQVHHDAVRVAQLFTSAIEKAMSTGKLSQAKSSTQRHSVRHEAVAQYLLDHILRQDGELRRLLDAYKVTCKHEPVLHAEVPLDAYGLHDSRVDHLVDDTTAAGDYRAVLVIEDKLDSQLGPDQLERYCEFLASENSASKLLVLHPKRNPLTAAVDQLASLQADYPGVTIEFETWSGLASRMVAANPRGAHVALWKALEEYTESVGTGDLENLADASVLNDPDVAEELRDLFLSMQNVASRIASGKSTQLRFSFHGANPRPWLQMAMTDIKKVNVGLELDLTSEPGTLLVGTRGPANPHGETTPSKLRVFKGGKLSPAGENRTEQLARMAQEVRDGKAFPESMPGRPSGAALSDQGQEALRLLAAIFQAQAIKNPHRGGAPSHKTRGLNEGHGNERLGAVLVRDDADVQRRIHLFIGPPAGQEWSRCTAWIRDEDGEREIPVQRGESGRDYVLRVWQESRTRLGW